MKQAAPTEQPGKTRAKQGTVAQVFRLKLALASNTFRRPPIQLLGMVISGLFLLGMCALATFGFVVLNSATAEVARVLVIVIGSLVVVSFVMVPLAISVDDGLDPRLFALLGIRTNRLALSLAAAALISVPSFVIMLLSLGQIVTWNRGDLPVTLAIAVFPVAVLSCVLLSRIATLSASLVLDSRRFRSTSGVISLLLLAVLAPAIAFLGSLDWERSTLPLLGRVAEVATWTPFGAVWSVPADAAIGHFDDAAVKFAIAMLFLVLLVILWRVLVGKMLVTVQREPTARRYRGLGWFGRLPATPFGVIAARSLSYWGRDSRYWVAIAVIPVVPIVMVLAFAIAGIPWDVIAWVPVPVMCLFLGWTVHNDLAHDSSAFWLHLAAHISGKADRWGRLVPALVIGLPLAIGGSVVSCAFIDSWRDLPALIGLSLSVLLVVLGISSVTSAAFLYPTTLPGESPFQHPQSASAADMVVQTLTFVVSVLSVAPIIWLILTVRLPWVTLTSGALWGSAVLIIGVLWGGAILDRRSPELLQFLRHS